MNLPAHFIALAVVLGTVSFAFAVARWPDLFIGLFTVVVLASFYTVIYMAVS